MQCDICGKKKATVHLTEIVDEQMSEMHLCEECARQKSTQMEQQFGLADLLAGLSESGPKGAAKSEEKSTLKCASCELNYEDFRKDCVSLKNVAETIGLFRRNFPEAEISDAVGHLGFTGTSIWLAPARDAIAVLLTNRVWPDRSNESLKAFRPLFHDLVWAMA